MSGRNSSCSIENRKKKTKGENNKKRLVSIEMEIENERKKITYKSTVLDA